MRWYLAALVLVATSAGCTFDVLGLDTGGGGDDAGADMAMPDDMAQAGPDFPFCAQCPNGCGGSPVHCLELQPSGPVTAGDIAGTGVNDISVNGDITVNTDDGTIGGAFNRAAGPGVSQGIGFRVQMQNGGPGVGVFSVKSLSLAANHKITIRGGNAFALASAGDVTIAGLVDGSCSGPMGGMPGPGGFAGGMPAMDGGGPTAGAGKAGANTMATNASGGGGGAYGDSGGSGGLIATQTTGNGGVPWGDLVSPTFTLVGGAGGGGGGNMGGKGGAGGGALQIVANGTITVAATGVVNVGGCGGVLGGKNKGGGGGGAGGAIVLEAIHVTLAGGSVLAANGGGGGSGDDGGQPGGNANASVTPASGGQAAGGGGSNGGNGGNGGASNGLPGQHFTNGRNGAIPDPATGFGGGGGGGVGRIAIRALNPTTGGISDSSTAVTPDAADINANGAHPTVYGAANFQ